MEKTYFHLNLKYKQKLQVFLVDSTWNAPKIIIT